MRNIDPKVEDALMRIDRTQFVPDEFKHEAEFDRPVPIGLGQTCSQPRLVAYMTDLLDVSEGSKVLEIGTGCGYQTALLLELGCHVYSIEIFPELAEQTEERLRRLGYKNFHIRLGDGSKGWPEEQPFDAAIFTCAIRKFPQDVLDQLRIGGRAVYPIEVKKQTQNLMKGIKNIDGELESEFKTSVLFVPLLNHSDEKLL